MNQTRVILTLFCLINISTAQPKLLLQAFGGYLYPTAEARGTLPGTINTPDLRYRVIFPVADSNSYFLKSGFQAGATAKLVASSKGYIRVVLNAIYKHLSSSQNSSLSNNNSTY